MKRHCAFSLTELLVVLGILAFLAAMLFPVLGSIRKARHVTLCAHNLRQIGFGFRGYIYEYGYAPPNGAIRFSRRTFPQPYFGQGILPRIWGWKT